jgi:predicted acyl esterase
MGVSRDRVSGYEKFEGPDPAEWVARGYAVINIDTRGAYDSEGDIRYVNPLGIPSFNVPTPL